MTTSRRWASLFFGGSGPDSLQGAFPFLEAENLRIGTKGFDASNEARKKKQEEWEEMGDGGSAPLLIYSKRRPTNHPHDHR